MKNNRRKFSAKFKAKVAIDALKEQKSISELSQLYEVHPNQISKWKREFQEGAHQAFGKQTSNTKEDNENSRLYNIIGQQKVEIDFLKKALS